MRRLCLLLLACVVLAGCGASGPRYAKTQLRELVLQPADVPAFSQFGFGKQARVDAHAGPRHDESRFGRIGGWIARYRRTGGSLATRGPLVVESRADIFGASSGASKDLDAYGQEYDVLVASAGARALDSPRVGDATRAYAFGSGSDNFYLVAWRRGNVTASVVVEGAHLTLRDALTLARKQNARIEAAPS